MHVLGCTNTIRVQRDHIINPRTSQNTNVSGGRGRGRNIALGIRTFIDNLVDRTNSSTGAHHQETPIRRISVTPGVATSVSTVENIGGDATPSDISAEEDRVNTAGSANRDLIYHINGKVVIEEEWKQFHKKLMISGSTKRTKQKKT